MNSFLTGFYVLQFNRKFEYVNICILYDKPRLICNIRYLHLTRIKTKLKNTFISYAE